MDPLTARQLSRETSEVLDRVERGETLEIKRGRRTIARLVPVSAAPTESELVEAWKEHYRWFDQRRGRRPKPTLDPVDELIARRRRRRRLHDAL